ncbi:hypothetical protein HanLR1_Chr16g0612741 [Helianthus annuus]|nr:hypothetical protein HanLR1_Chr16g0612741 [Helianthus annuus]
MPVLDVNDFTELVLRNLIAYELLMHSKHISQYITSYAFAMDMLIDNEEDIAKLVKSKVLVNNIGSNQEAANMINSICKEVALKDFFYSDQWKELNHHYNLLVKICCMVEAYLFQQSMEYNCSTSWSLLVCSCRASDHLYH